jgi:putative alpha-1,2-mannosidase
VFEEASLQVSNGQRFTVRAEGVSSENRYVQSATLNGQPLSRAYITHEEITAGGELVLTMGSAPNKDLWTQPAAYPPSMTPITP